MLRSSRQAALSQNESAAKPALPHWNLKDLYQSPQDEQIESDLELCAKDSQDFAQHYQGKLEHLSAADFAKAIEIYEQIAQRMGKLSCYAYLNYCENMADSERARFLQKIQEKNSDCHGTLLFFELEICALTDEQLNNLLQDPAVQAYAPFITNITRNKPHQLSNSLEQYINDTSTLTNSWVRLYDETLAILRFQINDSSHTLAEILHMTSEPSAQVRRDAFNALVKTLSDNQRLFAHIHNTLAKSKQINDKWRHFALPVQERNLSNHVEDQVVTALCDSVKASYTQLSHRYYAIKAKWMGSAKLAYWDRNAPLPQAQDGTQIGYERAQQIILEAYGQFSPELARIAKLFFDNNWIDAAPSAGKNSGAFSHPCVPDVHPYILMNYQGKRRDVATLAHELGHGVHQYLAGRAQGYFNGQTPLTLAETASVFGEMLTFQHMLSLEQNPLLRKQMLAGKVEDMLNTTVRQISFHDFEERLHAARRNGELSVEQINAFWLDSQRAALGDAVDMGDEFGVLWAYVPHFIHSPFYVYAYAFGDCLVNSLYAAYLEQPEGFAQKYMSLLAKGGSEHHSALLAPFGLDAKDPAFWHKGLAMISQMIDQIEQLEQAA